MECVARIVNSHKCISPAHGSTAPPHHGEGARGGVKHRPSDGTYLRITRNKTIIPLRLALKTGSYSLMHLTVAIAVTYAITQNWRAALAVGLIEPAVQTVAYLVHDRIWTRIDSKGVRKHSPNP